LHFVKHPYCTKQYVGARVVKTNMTCPFCVKCHISIHPNVFVAFVRMDARKSWVILGLPSLQLITKNGFQLPILQWPMFFDCQACNIQKKFVTIFLVCHCGLANYMKEYLKAKEEWWKFQYCTMQKYNLQKKIL
jgi:hypothetical protein